MNLILLFDEDFVAPGRVRLEGRRLLHMRQVHRVVAGARVRVGHLNGSIGEALILALDEQAAELEVELRQPPPSGVPVTLVMALPRPKMLKRCLRMVAETGVERLFLINSVRVEKSFWQSPWLQPEKIFECLLLGLEQARDTRLPQVHLRQRFKPFVEDELPGLATGRRALLADPGGAPLAELQLATPLREPALLCIGPEGGFVPYEVEKLVAAGCRPFTLGERVYRVESVLPLLLGRLFV
jgi:RsmE family RNA methyltransferase